MRLRSICVFAGSGEGSDPAYLRAARSLGALLAEHDIAVVYGGARLGLMGALAEAALGGGARVTGVIPDWLMTTEVAHPGLSEQRVVGSLHERKAEMARLSDAFVVLPGGLGTLEEALEAATWTQLGIHRKPCGLLNVGGFFDPLLGQLDRAVSDAFLTEAHRGALLAREDAAALLDALGEWIPPAPKRALRGRAAGGGAGA